MIGKALRIILVFLGHIIKDCFFIIGVASSILTILYLVNLDSMGFIQRHQFRFFVISLIAAVGLIAKNLPHLFFKIKMKIPNVNSQVIIRYGDILKSKNDICLATNNFLNIEPKDINPDGILAKIIDEEKNVCSIENELELNIRERHGYELKRNKLGEEIPAYKPGSVGYFTRKNGKKLYLMVISDVVYPNPMPSFESKKEYVGLALNSLWSRLRSSGNNKPLSMPVIGTGTSNARKSNYMAILDICDSFITESGKGKIIDILEIIIHKNKLSMRQFYLLNKTLKEITK